MEERDSFGHTVKTVVTDDFHSAVGSDSEDEEFYQLTLSCKMSPAGKDISFNFASLRLITALPSFSKLMAWQKKLNEEPPSTKERRTRQNIAAIERLLSKNLDDDQDSEEENQVAGVLLSTVSKSVKKQTKKE